MKKLLPAVCVYLCFMSCAPSIDDSNQNSNLPAFDYQENASFSFELKGETDEDGVFDVSSILVSKDHQAFQSLEGFNSKVQVNEEVIFEDINFDGYDDIRLIQYLSFNSGIPYYYWLYNPKTNQFERNESYEKIVSPRVDTANQLLISQWTDSKELYGNDYYKVIDNQMLKLVKQEKFSVQDSITTKEVSALVNNVMVKVEE